MSPKDLCTIGFLDIILKAGVRVLKIEGRGRSPEYVKTVTRCYKEAVESIQNNSYTKEKINNWMKQLSSVYNRGFWDGYYLGKKIGEWAEKYGSRATKTKIYVGKVTNYFSKLKVAEIKIETNELNVGDAFLVIGPTTGVLEAEVKEIRVELKKIKSVIKGDICSIPVEDVVRKNDKIYKLVESEFE